MNKALLIILMSFSIMALSAVGVLVNKNNPAFQIATLNSSIYEVNVNNQIAQVQVTENFTNNSAGVFAPRLYFPLPRGASATQVRWYIHGVWYTATLSPVPGGHPGGPVSFPDNFVVYIQLMPLIFDVTDPLLAEESISFQITYMQILNDNFGSVTINLKNQYTSMQTTPLQHQGLSININTDRQITAFNILDMNAQVEHSNYSAYGNYSLDNAPASQNYRCVWQLSTSVNSAYGLSTYQTTVPDEGANGFFLYSFEEDSLPADSSFALRLNIVIDVSGSMTWENRLTYAKQAATYIVSNLHAGDYFNIVLFDHVVRPLWGSLRPYSVENRDLALSYINNYTITSLNGTNLYGGLSTALSYFSTPLPGKKNCVILFSDGQANVGITDNYQTINSLDQQIANNHSDPLIFSFGIGSEVNFELLNQLAQRYHGIAMFLESSEIYSIVTSFYNVMRNPVFMSPSVAVTPAANVSEVYPQPFPTLYGGIQYRVVGRYNTAQPLNIAVSGLHEGDSHTFNHSFELSSTQNPALSFVPKVWAAAKIENLLIQYYAWPPTSEQAISLHDQIVDISLDYGVVCVFTSFTDTGVETEDDYIASPSAPIVLYPNYPNPFNPQTTLCFEVFSDISEDAVICIYNLKGQLVRVLKLQVNGKGKYSILWDGKDTNNIGVSSGVYVYSIKLGKYLLSGKMTLQK